MSALAGSVGLLTGASGFIGRAFLRQLPGDTTVFATYNSSVDFPAWAATLPADVRPVHIDLVNSSVAPLVSSELDWALCAAARVATAASRQNPVEELLRVAGPAVNAVAGLHARRIVHLSSGSVYERCEGRLFPGRPLDPRLPYSIGKLAGELLAKSYAEVTPWIVRFFGAFGPGEPHFKITRRLLDAFQSGATTFRVTGDGKNRIDAMYVSDAVAALAKLCASDAEPRTVDLCQGESVTISEFAQLVYEATHPAPRAIPLRLVFGGSAHEQMLGAADPAEADGLIGTARRSLREGLKEYAAWLAPIERA